MVNPQWWDPGQQPLQQQRYTTQLQLMDATFAGRAACHPPGGPSAATQFMYAEGRVLAADDGTLPAVLAALGVNNTAVTRPVAGVARIALPPGKTAVQARSDVQAATGADRAHFDRVLHVAASSACPATEPEVATSTALVPQGPQPQPALRDVHVAVIDTGLPRRGASNDPIDLGPWAWMGNVTGDPEELGFLGHYAGHGLFVAGVLATMAPTAKIHVHNYFFTNGGQIESDLVSLLRNALQADPRPDIISMSAGVVVPDGMPAGLSPMAVFYDQEIKGTDTVLVCAAGNNPGVEKFEPASLDGPIGVGALDATEHIAGFSNSGPWIDVFALGTNIVNAFENRSYFYQEPPMANGAPPGPGGAPKIVVSNRRVVWSGTSFSTPIVAGLIANHMAVSNKTAPLAWADLLAEANLNAPSHGGRPVLLV